MGSLPIALTPNLENQAIFNQGVLPLAFDKPISNYKPAAASFGPPRLFHFPGTHHISDDHSPIRHIGRFVLIFVYVFDIVCSVLFVILYVILNPAFFLHLRTIFLVSLLIHG